MEVINIILTVLVVAVSAYAAYKKMGATIPEKAAYLIAQCAKLDLLGAEKMQIVVDKLYENVPTAFKSILTKQKLQTIAQSIYDKMKAFSITEAEKENK